MSDLRSHHFEELGRDLTARLARLEFTRGEACTWSRLRGPVAEVVRLQREDDGSGPAALDVRLHLAVRALTDASPVLALNGPVGTAGYHTGSRGGHGRCVDELEQFVREVGEPWFRAMQDDEALEAEGSDEGTTRALLGLKASS